VPLRLSTLADQVGAGCAGLEPILRRFEAHVFAAGRLHGDDTTVPVLAKGKTDTGRCWVYVRDDRPFGGAAPPAAMFCYSRDRTGEHPQADLANYAGIFQADAYSGYNKLYEPDRSAVDQPDVARLGKLLRGRHTGADLRTGCTNSQSTCSLKTADCASGVGEDGLTAFTEYGIKCLKQIIADERAAGTAPTPIK
jgi:hypothetical protein